MPNPSEATRISARWVGVSVLISMLGWGGIAVYSVHASLPSNTVRLPFAEQISTRIWAPEGWAFFTRDPREEDVFVFAPEAADEGPWRSILLSPHASPSNLFGLDRYSRAQGTEIGLLLYELSAEHWRDCDASPEECLVSYGEAAQELENASPRPSLCGSIGFALQRPVPWAWASAEEEIVMPSRIAKVSVQC